MQDTKRKFLRNMVGFSLMTWITFALGFIASPIATRVFEQTELGKINLFTTYAALFGSVCFLGLDQAFARFYREPPHGLTSGRMLSFCFTTSLAFAAVATLGCLPWWPQISMQVTGEADVSVYVCLAAYCFAIVAYRYLSLSYRMEQNARSYTVQGVIYALLTKLGYVGVGLVSAQARPAIWVMTALILAFALVCIAVQRRRFERPVRANPLFVREMARYALPLAPMSIVSWFNSSLSQVALRNLLGFAAVGLYTPAVSLANTVNLVQSGFNTYWCPYVYQNYQNDNRRTFYIVHRLMACVLTFFGLAATLLQTPVFLLVGPHYRSSVVFFPFLLLSPICYCLSETTCMGIDLSKKTYWNTIIFLCTAAGNLLLCFWLIPLYSTTGAALAAAFSAVLMLGLRTVLGNRFYRAIPSYRYVLQTVGLMLTAAFLNLLLDGAGALKYALLLAVLLLAVPLYWRELRQLASTALEILRGRRARGAGAPPSEEA